MLANVLPDFLIYFYIILAFLLFVGYTFTSFFMIPTVPVQSKRTRFAGGMFFLTCGIMYLHSTLYVIFYDSLKYPRRVDPLVVILYLVQLVSAIVFIRGYIKEFKHVRSVIRLNEEVDEMIEEVKVLRKEAQERKS